MSSFHMVKYGRLNYPNGIPLSLVEVPGHFDIQPLHMSVPYSLHTEYSYGPRAFSSAAIQKYSSIPSSQKQGIPQLWTSMEWSQSFALFVARLTQNSLHPSVIEIHPPFADSVSGISQFLDNYEVFEDVMLHLFPDVQIVLENRTGTRNSRGFLIANTQDLLSLTENIEKRNLQLRLAVDFPQLLNAERASSPKEISRVFDRLTPTQRFIRSVHLWGRMKTAAGRFTSHSGDLNTWLPNPAAKNALLSGLHSLTDDHRIRWMVLEVNSGNSDLHSIIQDLVHSGFQFV